MRDIDLGVLNGHPFVYVAAFGMFSELSYLTTREMKQNMGYAAYVMGGIKSLAKSKPYKLKVEYDGRVIEDDFIYGMVSNSRRVGGMEMPIMKNVLFRRRNGDNSCSPSQESRGYQKLINCLVTQIADYNTVYVFKASEVKISCEDEIPWTVDGEFGGAYKSAEIVVVPAAVKMMF